MLLGLLIPQLVKLGEEPPTWRDRRGNAGSVVSINEAVQLSCVICFSSDVPIVSNKNRILKIIHASYTLVGFPTPSISDCTTKVVRCSGPRTRTSTPAVFYPSA